MTISESIPQDFEDATPSAPPADPQTQQQAMAVGIMGLLLGLIGSLFFFEIPPGINVPLYNALFVAVGAGLVLAFRVQVWGRHVIFALPALGFAAAVAWYASPTLTALNLLATLGLLTVATRFAQIPGFLSRPFGRLLQDGILLLASTIEVPIRLAVLAGQWLTQQQLNERQSATLGAIARGLTLAAPILLVFIALLASADAVFSDLVGDGLAWIVPDNLTDLIGRGILMGFFAWLAVVGLSMLVMPQEDRTIEPQAMPPLVGTIETIIIMGSINALFALFVAIQFRYFFGGEANIADFTYAEYARRGFFELLAVSFMVMLLILGMQAFGKRTNVRWFRGLAWIMMALTGILLVSSFQRLSLYEDAFGFTRLRVMTQVFTVWLGILFGVLALHVAGKRVFWLGVILACMGYIGTLNLLNLDAFIAERNIERYHETGKLDGGYLLGLSEDAMPQIVTLLGTDDAELQTFLLDRLGSRLWQLDNQREDWDGLGYHHAKVQAWELLDTRRDTLSTYIDPPTSSLYYDDNYLPDYNTQPDPTTTYQERPNVPDYDTNPVPTGTPSP